MKVPYSGRKKALIVVDVQPAFITARNQYIVRNIATLIKKVHYNLYFTALFHSEKGSLWDKQQNWICPKDKNFHTALELTTLLNRKNTIAIKKKTKSVFKGNKNLVTLLKSRGVEEVHIIGFDTNDCVLASAYEAFDLGFFTYVLEECCESSSSARLHKQAIALLRRQNMTNNSVAEKINSTNL